MSIAPLKERKNLDIKEKCVYRNKPTGRKQNKNCKRNPCKNYKRTPCPKYETNYKQF